LSVASRRLNAALRRLRGKPGVDPLAAELYLKTMEPRDRRIVERSLPYTMTGVPRLMALIEAVRYCVRADVPGELVECGVWRGGSVMAMILTLQDLGVGDRDVYLFDTFGEMAAPGERDSSPLHGPALELWRQRERSRLRLLFESPLDPWVGEDGVRELLAASGYPQERLHVVSGRVEETLPARAPDRLALLRLDTDWYESTRHELVNLYPRLSEGGVLIVDDYGSWEGCRQAVDEYFAEDAAPPLLSPIDYTGRVAVKR
jgi:O-methyltransferase